MRTRVVILSSIMAICIVCVAGVAANAQQIRPDFMPCQEVGQAEFDPALIAPLPVDLASVEQTLLSEAEHKMLGQEGDEVRFIIYDESLPNGQGQFSFNTKTFFLSYEGEEEPLVKYGSAGTDKESPGGGLLTGCYYRFTGPINCWGHTLYGYFCLSGSWYCYLLGGCR